MKLPRREFLKRSAGLFGAASVMGAFPKVIQRALAIAPNANTGTIADVEHVVILMQENRSFDHYFGTLRGVRGFGDRFPIPLESGQSVWLQSDGQKLIPPFHLDSATTSALLVGDTPHNFPDAQAAWNQGKYGQWPRFKTANSMGHYQREDIPFQFALAEAFTICDAYHCSLTAGTDPNRIMFMSGTNADPQLRAQGINCTSANAEVVNLRCAVWGTMPTPGYGHSGSAFEWPTLPELLQAAGVSWKIYQDPNNNWSGLMHGGLAFASFRNALPGSPLYENGMQLWTLDDLRNDVANGTLPSVSWVLPTPQESEHPSFSPVQGADLTANLLDALTLNPDSWSKTAFFVTYDENDGFFDHMPPPAVPSFDVNGNPCGKSTVSTAGEYFSDPKAVFLMPQDTISGTLRPWGLGARVPMYVVSPWSKGGWVNSQIYDHTSMAMFLERRFGIRVDSISPWHRAVCGDLTAAFAFASPDFTTTLSLPDVSNFLAVEAAQRALPAPAPAASQLFQETGTRPSRALPYELHTSARTGSNGQLTLLFSNSGTQGAVFHVYDLAHLDRIPRRYTVEAGKLMSDEWDTAATDAGNYQLQVYAPNGFYRSFQGNTLAESNVAFNPEIQICYDPSSGAIYLKVRNSGSGLGTVTVTSNAYRTDGPWTLEIAANSMESCNWDLGASGRWYDFTVTSGSWNRRFAGRVETGMDSVSDPAMGLNL